MSYKWLVLILLSLMGFASVQTGAKEGRYDFTADLGVPCAGAITLKKASNGQFNVGGYLKIGDVVQVVSGTLKKNGVLAATVKASGARGDGDKLDGEWDSKLGTLLLTRLGSRKLAVQTKFVSSDTKLELPVNINTPAALGKYSGRSDQVEVRVQLSKSSTAGQYSVTGTLRRISNDSEWPISGTYYFGGSRNEIVARAMHSKDMRNAYFMLDGPFRSGKFQMSVAYVYPGDEPEGMGSVTLAPGELEDLGERAKRFTGKWDIGLKDNVTGTKPVIMTLQCNGKNLSGSYPLWYSGTVVGDVQPDGSIKGQWTNNYRGGDGGEFTMTLSEDGNTWSGTWKGRYDSGSWSGKRVSDGTVVEEPSPFDGAWEAEATHRGCDDKSCGIGTLTGSTTFVTKDRKITWEIWGYRFEAPFGRRDIVYTYCQGSSTDEYGKGSATLASDTEFRGQWQDRLGHRGTISGKRSR